MALKSELILQALVSVLATINGPALWLNEPFPVSVPDGGLLILRDLKPGDPVDVTLSPVTYSFEGATPLELAVQHADTATRDALYATLLEEVQQILAANKTLGGLCEYLEPTLSDFPDLLPIEGGSSIKAVMINIAVSYTSDNSLG